MTDAADKLTLERIFERTADRTLSVEDALALVLKSDGIDERSSAPDIEPDSQVLFVREFSHDEPSLRDHVLLGERVVLGAACCSMAMEGAMARRAGARTGVIRNIFFDQPIIIKPQERARVVVRLNGSAANRAFQPFSVCYSLNGGGDQVAARGELIVHGPGSGALGRVDLQKLHKRVEGEIFGPDIYAALPTTSVVIGRSLRTIASVACGADETLARLSLPNKSPDGLFDPALLNGAMMSGVFGSPTAASISYVPMLIKQLRWRDRLTSACWAHTIIQKQNAELLIVDIEFCDDEGNVLLAMDGVTLKRVRREAVAGGTAQAAVMVDAKTDRAGTTLTNDLAGLVSQYLKQFIAQVLGTNGVDFADRRNFMDLGLDSADLVALARNLESALGTELFPTLFFEHQNISELTDYLLAHHTKAVEGYFDKRNERNSEPAGGKATTGPQPSREMPQSSRRAAERGAIAIIGMSGRFGGSRNLDEFWRNLADGNNLITEIPPDHFDYKPWFVAGEKVEDKTYCKWGSFISDVDKFDAAYFNISPREAQVMDPQLRLLLETFVHTANDAGYGKRILGTNTGVYVGTCFYDYKQEMERVGKAMGPHDGTGNSPTMMSNRPSFFFDLKGPSLTIDTSCSSSLVALDLAVQALRRGECEMAFVGAANLLLCSWHYRYFCSIEALSHTGRCHSFDARADGYVPGEAVAAVLLKPLDQALLDNDRIHAVIKGTAVNHGGRTQSVTAPSVKQEAKVIRAAWEDAGTTSDAIGYIEAHGTGTRLGDPIEIDALKRCFGGSDHGEKHCAIGSAKAHVGHTEGAAGLTAVIKTVLSLQQKTIPAMPMFAELNEFIRLDDTPLYINRQTQEWPQPRGGPRTAGVSSFGFGGTYAHVVVQEFKKPPFEEAAAERDFIFVLSAKNVDRLNDCCSRFLEFLRRLQEQVRTDETHASSLSLARIEATLLLGREEMNCRLAVLARTEQELISRLAAFLDGTPNPATTFARQMPAREGDDGEADPSVLIARCDIAGLAASWVRGAQVDWKLLYDGKPPPPISLFEYPFAKERHWYRLSQDPAAPRDRLEKAAPGYGAYTSGRTYVPCTIPCELSKTPHVSHEIGCLLVFTWDGALEERLAAWANTNGSRLVLVKPAEQFRRLGPDRFEIDTRAGNDYFELCRTLLAEGAVVTHVLHLWTLDEKAEAVSAHPRDKSEATLDTLRTWGIYSVFHIIKALGNRCGRVNRFLYAFRERRREEMPELESISGYRKSIAAVYPDLAFSVVGFQGDAGADEVFESVLEELAADPPRIADEIAYVNGQRLVRSFKQVNLPEDSTKQSVLRAGDTVLITGGAGKLGLIFARHLAARYAVRVVLMGRSSLSEQERATFESTGPDSILYLKGDVGNRHDVESVLEAIKARYGRLNGVIHTAGAITTTSIESQSFREFQEGLRAKVEGLINLDEATKHEQLRLFMIFSSLSSILGDFGQCNYAIANRYCDAYGDLREWLRANDERRGRTVVVNWPLWRAGNKLNGAAEELYLRSGGLAYLETSKGCEIFDALLATDYTQLVCLEGNGERIDKLMSALAPPTPDEWPAESFVYGSASPRSAANSTGARGVVHALSRQITRLLAGLLAVDEGKVPSDSRFAELGVDSIVLKEFTAKLGDLFATKLSPNIVFNHPSISDLSEYLAGRFPDQTATCAGEQESRHLSNRPSAAASQLPSSTAAPRAEGGSGTADDIAIIGMSLRFPGADDADEFWRLLEDKRNLVREIPVERWDLQTYYDGLGIKPLRSISKWGGFLDDADAFDAEFFNISPAEAEVMDPQHRIFLQTAWKAVEDAGYAPSHLAGRSVGVFAGVQFNDYQNLIWDAQYSRPQIGTGNSHAMLANRVSFLLNLKGPSEAIDTACSSSIVALHRAVRSLIDEECELALVGGVSLIANVQQYIVASQLGMLSPDGCCRPFDERANGFVKGEGAGVLLLKPLPRALSDRDHVYAVIKGSAVNHGGRASSLTAPDAAAQAQVIQAAISRAGVDANTIGYIETHGTGTELGDPIEIEGLNRAFDFFGDGTRARCAIGSVKANIGHLEAASGIASIIKTALSLTKKKIPGTLNFGKLNPHIQLGDRFFVATEITPWPKREDQNGRPARLRAGVSAFGFGGSNAHVVLEESVEPTAAPKLPVAAESVVRPELITLSAKNRDRLREYAQRLRQWCAARDAASSIPPMRDIAFTLQAGRDEMDERLAIVAANLVELIAALKDYEDAVDSGSFYCGSAVKSQSGVDEPLSAAQKAAATAEVSNGLIQSQDWHALARAWVGGAPVDWNLVKRSAPVRRVSLPGYPFARTRYWITACDGLGTPQSTEKSDNSIAINSVDERTFVAKLTGREPFIADHVIRGRRILSAAAHLEIARQVGEVYRQSSVSHIRDVVWAKPVFVKGETVDLFVRVTPAAGDLEFEISPAPKFGSESCSRGCLRFAGADRPQDIDTFDHRAMDRFRSGCRTVRSGQDCYRALAASGYDYGPAYRTIRELRSNAGQVVADLADRAVVSSSAFVMRPTLLDGVFQSIIGPNLSAPSDSLLLPYAVEEIVIAAPMAAECSAYLTLQEGSPAFRHGLRKADVIVVNSDGRIALAITGISFMGEAKPGSGAAYDGQPQAQIVALLRQIVAAETRIPPEAVTAAKPFEAYGVDSVMILALTRRLEEHFGRLPKTLLFEHRNIEQLASYLANLAPGRQLPSKEADANLPPCSDTVVSGKALPFANGGISTSAISRDTSPNDGEIKPDEAIAVIGLSGRYPMAEDLDAFWKNLTASRDCITEVPESRWDHAAVFSPDVGRLGATYGKWGGFLDGVEMFDADLFNIAPRDAAWIDPQERLFLETVWQALEDAGYTRKALSGRSVGVFVGVMYGHYQLLGVQIAGRTMHPGVSYASIANRVSYTFDLNGPSIALDTMCSSSLTAIKLACDSLRNNESELAIAGGVNITIHPSKYTFLSQGRYLASDGRCRAFGAGGDGYVPGEGVGAAILKPLARAIADRDHIYGVIRASAVNHGGKTHGYTVPNPDAQSAVIRAAVEQAKVHPRSISFIEAHGTGTALGDPIEISGLVKAFGHFTADKQFCALGSVKSNIGHLESAAGIAALSKVLLQMKHKTLVPTLHAETINPHIDFAQTPFFLQRDCRPWERPVIEIDGGLQTVPRRAGISSFGAGGSNAHLVVDEYEGQQEPLPPAAGEHLIVLSARSGLLLRKAAERLVQFVRQSAGCKTEHAIPSEATLAETRERIASLLSVSESEIDVDANLVNYGIDSGHFASLATGLGEQFGIELIAVSFSGAHSVRAIARIVASLVHSLGLPNKSRAEDTSGRDLLAKIAFTLQVGREPARERVAWVVASMGELERALSCFCGEASDALGATRCYVGTVADTGGEQPVALAEPSHKNNNDVARAWVSGTDVDWMSRYPDDVPGRISLPSSPLRRRRCWVDSPSPGSSGRVTTMKPEAAETTDADGRNATFEEGLKASLAEILAMDVSELDAHRPFEELGMTSVAAVDWMSRINRQFAISIPPTAIYDHPTLEKFTRHLQSSLPPDTSAPASTQPRQHAVSDGEIYSPRKLADIIGQIGTGEIDFEDADRLLSASLFADDQA